MSQVGSRPMTQQSMMGRLPEIQHPLSRMTNPGDLDIRGVSRGGERSASQLGGFGRPLTCESNYNIPKRHTTSRGRVSKSYQEAPTYDRIPEGVEVSHGDHDKPRMPIFGNRAEVASRSDMGSRMSHKSSQLRLEIDELEAILKEKVQNNYHDLKKKFKSNDPELKGTVSRDALCRILITITNRAINQSQFSRLMERLGLRDKIAIHYSEFFALFRDTQSVGDFPRWVDPVQRHWQDRSAAMTAVYVHGQLKEKVKQRDPDIGHFMPQSNTDATSHLPEPEFRNILNKIGFVLNDIEFEKLCSKYDIDGVGSINREKFLNKIGFVIEIDSNKQRSNNVDNLPESRGLRKKEAERQRSLNIERWLKDKFREGFLQMKQVFQTHDPKKTGMISHDKFLGVLMEFGLKLEKDHLAEFLARCSVDPTNSSVPYRDFLHRFQDRSEAGMTHNILTNPKHRYNRPQSPDAISTHSALETQMLNMLQRDFLALLGTFHKIDKLGMDVISQEEFRAAIESRFDLELTEEQFGAFIERVPLDAEGNVRYAEFMSQFDTRGKAKSLYTQATAPAYKHVKPLPEDKSPVPPPISNSRQPDQSHHVDRLVVDPSDDAYKEELFPKRSPQELFKLIKHLMKKNFQETQDAFYELDEQNTKRLSQETMYHLMKKLDIKPEITRGEIRDLWKTFITNQDKTLDFLQFMRHFGYSPKSAAFPNAKIRPPRRGDSDFFMRSKKLNCAADMLHDNLRAKIDYMWDDLRREFVTMDPYATGCVMVDEFREVLSELCVHLNDVELDLLCNKYQNKGDGRVSYIAFLKPFAMKRQTHRHGNFMMTLLQHPGAELQLSDVAPPPQKGLVGMPSKLRQKLVNDWKNLRRAFKKLDVNNEGYLSVPEFRSVLKLANIVLDEEEVYQVLSTFDENMTGKIPYNKFLSETHRPLTQEHSPADLLF